MTQTLLTIFIPTLMVLVGILLNRNDSARIDGRISSLENRLDGRISSLEGKLDGRISSLEGKLDGRISALESRLHGDMMQVIGKLTEPEVRVARLEQNQ
jgi:hypothetical protein